ncbi:MAG: M48 family metallopeptidase [Methanobrevibacter sp.]|jgi:predicted Zn-dependent protease|nr:M48 family metallopeptidase [Methanobrevibacter sp.]
MKKNERSSINPFTGKKHFDIVNDDNFLDRSYDEYYQIINQSNLLDKTNDGQILFNVALKLINAVENHLLKINRSDYTKDYYDWEFHLVSNDTVNAMCMPGGKIIVLSGILSIANNEERLAFILAHEMAHALLDHSRTRVSAYNAKNTITTVSRLGTIGLSLIGLGDLGSIARTAINIADIGSEYLLMKPFGRSHELEADELGMMIVKWAGYDIGEIPKFWQKMSEHNSNKHDFFSTHPSDNKRIVAMNELVLEISNQKDFHNDPVLSDNQKNTKNDNIGFADDQIGRTSKKTYDPEQHVEYKDGKKISLNNGNKVLKTSYNPKRHVEYKGGEKITTKRK